MEDALTTLDAALTGERPTSEFAEKYPDTPEWAVELSDRIAKTRARLERAERAKAQRRQALRDDLERTVAAIAMQVGVATDAEKRRLKAEQNRTDSNQDDLAAYFTPETTRGDTQ